MAQLPAPVHIGSAGLGMARGQIGCLADVVAEIVQLETLQLGGLDRLQFGGNEIGARLGCRSRAWISTVAIRSFTSGWLNR